MAILREAGGNGNMHGHVERSVWMQIWTTAGSLELVKKISIGGRGYAKPFANILGKIPLRIWWYRGRVCPMGNGFCCMSWDAVGLRGNSSIHIANGMVLGTPRLVLVLWECLALAQLWKSYGSISSCGAWPSQPKTISQAHREALIPASLAARLGVLRLYSVRCAWPIARLAASMGRWGVISQ